MPTEHRITTEALPFLLDRPNTTPCPACRVEVVMHPDPFGRPDFYRPVGYAYVQDEQTGTMRQRTVFTRHACEEMSAWRNRLAEVNRREEDRRAKERRNLISEENRLRREANRADRAEQWEQAMQVECPKCGVGPTVRCENLTERRNGHRKVTAWPHGERVIAATSGLSRPDIGTQIEREGGIS